MHFRRSPGSFQTEFSDRWGGGGVSKKCSIAKGAKTGCWSGATINDAARSNNRREKSFSYSTSYNKIHNRWFFKYLMPLSRIQSKMILLKHVKDTFKSWTSTCHLKRLETCQNGNLRKKYAHCACCLYTYQLYRPVFCRTFLVGPVQRDLNTGTVNLSGGHTDRHKLLKNMYDCYLRYSK